MANHLETATQTISLSLPLEIVRFLDDQDEDRTEFIIQAVRNEVRRRGAELAPEQPDEIDQLYRELRELNTRVAEEPELRAQIASRLSRLRELQTAEALEMRRRFEAQLPMKPGTGWQALEKAEALLRDDDSAT